MLSPESVTGLRIFMPYAFERSMRVINGRWRFVHYTSADVALSILQNREVWMRKSSCMNDFMEIEHGWDLLNKTYSQRKNELVRVFDPMFPGFVERLEKLFNGWLPEFRTNTYITCMSEHDGTEDRTGRLSMWRAYGGEAGIAMVVNSQAFLSDSEALGAYSSPVAYLGEADFGASFDQMLQNVRSEATLVEGMGEDHVLGHVFNAFRSAILCTKHQGFREEREWRVIYSPGFQRSQHVKHAIVSVHGHPQPIYKIPLRNIPDERLTGIEIPELVDRVIIGPCKYPAVMYEAFVTVLRDAGVQDAQARVHVSDIPLRK